MSILNEMGIQQWRLRGRKPVKLVGGDIDLGQGEVQDLVEAHAPVSDAVLGSQAIPDSASNSNVQASAALLQEVGQTVHSDLDTQQSSPVEAEETVSGSTVELGCQSLNKGADSNENIDQQSADLDSKEVKATKPAPTSAPISAATPIVGEGLEAGEHLKVDETSTTPLISVSDTTSSKEEVPELAMPTLRPAPVAFEAHVEVDLTIADTSQNKIVEQSDFSASGSLHDSLQSETTQHGDADQSSEYNDLIQEYSDSEIPPHNADWATDAAITNDSEIRNYPPEANELSSLDWRALQARISDHQECPSCGQAQSTLGFGDVLADWMFIADAATSPELQAQQLFIGRAGQLFEGILSACNLQRQDVYSTTVFKCSPPEDMSLSPQCDKLVHRQIELVQPKVIITFGEFASQAVLRANESFDLLRKGRHLYPGMATLVIPSYAPAQLLADPVLKAELWTELKSAMQSLI